MKIKAIVGSLRIVDRKYRLRVQRRILLRVRNK